ncbi:MAG: Ig-like domain-containing protein, partial [Verrucomicrobia subdivision 3 bacterium]|nr:Ig-like domain-containing protein [Limisphaerales bacterium]
MKIMRLFSTASGTVLALAVLATAIPTNAQIVTNWVAYNDQVPNYNNPVNGWVTHSRTTGHDMGEAGATGNLINFYSGEQLDVIMTSFHTGPLHNFGLAVAPNTNTPAAQLFRGIIDISNEGNAQPAGNVIGVQFSPEDYATFTFSGLDPNKRYVFRGTAVRGGSYPLRWTVATIIGARTFVDAHINGVGGASASVLTSNNFPASLEPGQAAWNAGDNRAGAVIGWDFITPAEDGTFSIQSSNYVGQIPGGTAANNIYSYAINAMLLAEVEVAPPAITQQPAAQTSVEQNRPFSLSVLASGTPLFYQWYKQGSGLISGATFATYSVSQAAFPGDTGDYFVVVSNPLGSQTSSVAHVTVNADVTGPGIATAFSYPTFDFATQAASLNQVIIEFNEGIEAAGATDPTRYVVSGGIGNPASVVLTNDRTVALQLSTALAEDTPYTVQVSGILDLVGNNISNGGTNNPAPFRSWMRGPGNGLLFEVFDGIGGSSVADLTSSPLYPDNASLRTNLWIFDSRAALPDDMREDYGSRTRGVFIPPVSGDWIFYLRGIDISRLFLNPNGLDAAGKQFMCEEAHADTDGNWGRVLSSPVSLRAGQAYYIEALHKSDTAADVIKVAARLLGTGVPPGVPNAELDTNAVMGAAIGSPLAPRDLGGTLTIAQPPTNTTAEANHPVTFSV